MESDKGLCALHPTRATRSVAQSPPPHFLRAESQAGARCATQHLVHSLEELDDGLSRRRWLKRRRAWGSGRWTSRP